MKKNSGDNLDKFVVVQLADLRRIWITFSEDTVNYITHKPLDYQYPDMRLPTIEEMNVDYIRCLGVYINCAIANRLAIPILSEMILEAEEW